MKKTVLLLIASMFLYSCTESGTNVLEAKNNNNSSPYAWVTSVHTTLGVPFDKDTTNDYIIVRDQYVVSYNNSLGQPNWVSWELNSDWYGDVERYSGNFITDNSLPAEYTKIKHDDYTNSGYDRGHLVRSEERTATVEDNKSTFLMTNVSPQTPDLNRGVWLKFEYYCEDLCKKENKELFVIAGGIYHNTTTLNDAGKVVVPDSCWKIVVVLEKGQSLEDVTANTIVFAVCMPNIAGVRKEEYSTYFTTIDKIEESTGYDFLSEVLDDTEAVLERK